MQRTVSAASSLRSAVGPKSNINKYHLFSKYRVAALGFALLAAPSLSWPAPYSACYFAKSIPDVQLWRRGDHNKSLLCSSHGLGLGDILGDMVGCRHALEKKV